MTRKHLLRRSLIVFLVLVLAAAAYVVIWLVPDYRTTYVIDTSATQTEVDARAVARAVGSAARNSGNRDALSLRRFGGGCGDPDNTASVVESGRRNGQQIGDASEGLPQSGEATLHSGILAAIDDFSGWYPFRGWKANRIIVVTSHGADACDADPAAALRSIRERVESADLDLDIRFVGYKVPENEVEPLAGLAAATGAPAPTFASTAEELETALRTITTPEPSEASQVEVPADTTTTSTPPQPVLIAVYVALSDWDVKITTDVAGTEPCVKPAWPLDSGRESKDPFCSFVVPQGTVARMTAEISGTVLGGIPDQGVGERPTNGVPVWLGCDEPPVPIKLAVLREDLYEPGVDDIFGTLTCTLNLTTGRAIALGSTDMHSIGGTRGAFRAQTEISRQLGDPSNRIPIPVGITRLEDVSASLPR